MVGTQTVYWGGYRTESPYFGTEYIRQVITGAINVYYQPDTVTHGSPAGTDHGHRADRLDLV